MSELRKQAKALLDAAESVLNNVDATEEQIAAAEESIVQAESLIERAKRVEHAKTIKGNLVEATRPAPLPVNGDGNSPVEEPVAKGETPEERLAKAVHILRFGEEQTDDPASIVMREIYGQDYRSLKDEQNKAFASYLRRGVASPVLTRQVWDVDDVRDMLAKGMQVRDIKATMVEGTDVLGGYAVPVDVANAIIRRLRGLTAVRAAGATVIQTEGKSIEWLRVTGGNTVYTGALRGAWGSETQSPAETNMTLGALTIPVNVYTFKMPMSVSLLEDARNVVDLFSMEVSEVLAVDEDDAFVSGDGANKPYGILPGGLNDRSLQEKNSGNSSALTYNGLKALARGVASQYRGQNATILGESATGLAIEQLQDANTRNYVDSLVAGEFSREIGGTWRENESMPSVAANAFPLVYGDFSGYGIVERLGLSIQRYNDSNTGINKVEFHVRRRIGGDVLQPWKFAVQKVAA